MLYIILDTKVDLDSLQPLPAKRPYNPRASDKPPSLVYTSPESLEFIKSHNKHAGEDFDSLSLLGTRAQKKAKQGLKRKLDYGKKPEATGSKPKRKATQSLPIVDYSSDDNDVESDEEESILAPVHPSKAQLGRKGGKLPILKQEPYFKCGTCKLKASKALEYMWIYCPICLILNHKHCIENECQCGFKPKENQLKVKKIKENK